MKTRDDDLPMANKSMTVDSTVPGNQSPTFSWKTYNRRKAVNEMHRHQRRIFKATKAGNMRKVRAIQKTLIKSLPARFLAVLRVTSSSGRLFIPARS
ncbi:MAG: reverse transcriptase N-terminal domain-containing protein [Promethearchaeota archaeon]